MLRQTVHRGALVGCRWKSTQVPSSVAAWSDGEVCHPRSIKKQPCPTTEFPHKLPDGGIQYFGFTYYPRYPDEPEPEYEPQPLHMVTRTRGLKGKPWWEKEIMENIGLSGKRSDVAILKNNPENNAMLWKVKHMVKITPIKLPKNLPKDANPLHLKLKESGEVEYTPTIQVVEKDLEQDRSVDSYCEKKLITKEARRRWTHPWHIKM